METQSIKNNSLSILVHHKGAELCSVKNKAGEEFIWQADKSTWARHAPVLFPIVGKLRNDNYNFNGKNYSLAQHGFARDKEFILVERTDSVLEFELTASEESLQVYPFHFSLRIRYELNGNKIKVSYTVFNPNNFEMVFSIGAHPGFNCKLEDHELDFGNITSLTAQKLKEGLISDETYEIKFNKGKLGLAAALFDNDALVFKGKQIEEISLLSKKTACKIKMTCKDWPYFGIWSKKGSDAFVCLEPWYGIADSVNASGELIEKEGILKLEAHKNFECGFEMEFN
jgi:galactose mutarotase-like enzyme